MLDVNSPGPKVIDLTHPSVVVYGTSWCAASQMVRRFLDRKGIRYVYRDLERDPQALRQVQWLTGGYASHPTVQVGGEVLVEPSLQELNWVLAQKGWF
jgi:mycoredoxin